MKHLKETAKRTANVLLAFILAFSFCPIAPSAAIADEGGLQPANASGLTAGSSSFLTGVAELIAQAEVAELTAQAEGDAAVYDWASLQEAINKSTPDAPVVLARDIVAGKDDESLRIEDWNSHALDLNGHTIDRNLTKQDDDHGHVIDVYRGTLTIRDSSAEKTGTITGGYAENGGGIVVSGSGHLNFESGTITGNQAYNGGGIYVYPADGSDTGIQLNMTGGAVTGNVGGDCGGIYTRGNAQISNVAITDNSTRGAGGGGLNNKGTATVTNCTISRNVADWSGGGIYNDGNLTLSGCTISDNTSRDSGGGISSHKTLTADTCTITGNSAAVDGGGIYFYNCTTTLANCTINNNKAEASGGAIRAYDGTVELNHTALNKNEAAEYGGGIYCNNDNTLKLLNSSSITECIGYKGGGGVYVAGGMKEVQVGSGVVVKDNKANNIYLRNGKTLNVIEELKEGTAIGVSLENYGGTFTTGFNATSPNADPNSVFVAEPGYSVVRDKENGEARVLTSDWIELQALIDETEDGGRLELDRSWRAVDENVALSIPSGKRITIELNGYTIDRHRSDYTADGEVFTVNGELTIVDSSYGEKGAIKGGWGDAGGVRVNGGGTFKLLSGSITDNHAVDGGGVCVYPNGTFEAYGGAITGNTSDSNGGGVYNSGTFTNSGCSISDNTADFTGGGVYIASTTTLNSGKISSNKADDSGGGIFVAGGSLTVNKGGTLVDISSNTAGGDGGGLYVLGDATATFNAGTITGNSTEGNGGGVYLARNGTLNFYDASMKDNYAAYDGGGIYNAKGTLNVKGAPQVTQNAAAIGRNILLSKDSRVTITGALSTAESGKAHLDVITLDPGQALTSGFTAQGCDISCFTTNDADHSQLQVYENELLFIQGTGSEYVATWEELKEAVQSAATGERIVLKGDVVAGDDDVRILLEDGKNLTIDLNGYKVDRNLGGSDDDEDSDGHVFEVDGDATLNIIDTIGTGTITGGYADNGGGIYVHEGSTLNLQGGTIMGNRADEDGGGVYARGIFNSTGGAVVRNRADDNGGGVYAERDGNLKLLKTVIANNTSVNEGGGVDVRVDREDATLTACQIRDNNTEDDHGGGVYLNKSSLLLTLDNCDVQGNHSDNGHWGGGIYVNDGRITVNGGTISNNRSIDGGGVYNNECAVVLNGTTLSGNSTLTDGGAGVSNHGSCQLYNCVFTYNVADGEGGAVYSAGDDYLRAENCIFTNNKSKKESGGAICALNEATLTNCTFKNNSAHDSGGGLIIHDDATINGGTFSGNEATEYGGGIKCDEDSTLRLVGTTSEISITNNSSSLGGSGLHVAHHADDVSMEGKITIKDNDSDNDFYLSGNKSVDIDGVLDGSQIRVVLERGTGKFTTNLKKHLAEGVDPATIFLAQTGQWVIPTSDNEAQVVASDWPMLQKLIDDTPQGGTLTLAGDWNRDWKAAQEDVALPIASGKKITIDLNGHTIDRARTDYQDEGQVFNVCGVLTVCDTSEGATGKICGANGAGGGVVVQRAGRFNFEGGNIQDNRGKLGGGILVKKGGNLSITGGTIANNSSGADGGGVYVEGEAVGQGHAFCEWKGGTITNNTAHGNGGGLWLGQNITFQMGGKLNVTDNVASSGENLYLGAGTTMNVIEALDAGSHIDLIAESPNRALTSGLGAAGALDDPLSVFTYNGARGALEIRNGELWVIHSEAAVEVSDWKTLQKAINDEANRDKVICLAKDIKATDDDDRLLLDGKSVIVDLNGHMLNRDLDDDDKNGHVFEVKGGSTLTIRDSAGAGRVTGGYAKHGGAINIAEDSTCNIEGGTFTGNRASDEGGAFYVYGKLIMVGGVITQNTAESGGGIFVDEDGAISLINVTIVDNKADKWGGGGINNKGNAALINCTIKQNSADNEGGAIYNGDKQLTLEGCTITDNSSDGGGGLCCYGTVNINDTTISDNYGDDYGGGLYTRGTVTITNSHITGNTGKDDGGGIFNQGGLLTVTDTEFSGNTTEAGGGALNNKGTAALTNCTLTGNHADSEGGCIYEGTDGATTIDGCTIQSNSCGKDGGGISACGTMTIANSTIGQNTAEKGGGGVYSYGDTTIVGTTVNENTSGETGGGLLSRKRSLTLDGVTVTANTAESTGGGLMVEGGSGDVVLKGAVDISDNNGSGDVFLSDGKVLTVGAALATDAGKANVWVHTEKGKGVVFTSGYSDFCAGTDPAEYFSSNDGFQVYLEGSEASTRSFTTDGKSFIDQGSQINPNVGTLTGANWMSGISGERRLNEINMPGTHDSATARVVGNLSTGSTLWYISLASPILDISGTVLSSISSLFGSSYPSVVNEVAEYFSTFANCQTRYIDEQLVDGIRSLDLRVNTYKVDPGYPPQPKEDNGKDLYLCHGKVKKGGTFFAYDERISDKYDPDFITFKEVLVWVKEFLEEHPTECIMMNVQVESVDDVEDLGMARIKKHLHDELATQINPSTGKPYLYMQDGVFGKLYTEYPKLKDCRGQVVLNCGDGEAEILGGLTSGVGLDSVERPDGSYKDNAEQKIRNLRRFFADHGNDDLPTGANEHINYLYSVGTNGTDSRSIPRITPLEIARDVLKVMFNEDDGLIVDKAGKYLGLINMDAETAKLSKIVWSSNFFNNLEYCNVTVKSGFGEEVVETTSVLYMTKITIPECIYDNPNSEGKYFQTWQGTMDNSISGITWESDPGETFYITGDTTFTAQWGDQYTPVIVLWRDADDKDELKPEKLSISYAGSDTPVDIEATKNWKVKLPGSVAPADITVNWDRIGEDAEGTYACKVREREGGIGLVIELTHTPVSDPVAVRGTVNWVDNDNAAGKRPENVTVRLMADSSEIEATTATAEGDWVWDFGNRPAFVDGQKIEYRVEEGSVGEYETNIKGFNITNVLSTTKQTTHLSGMVFWADNNNADHTRPQSVTINLLKNGEQIASQEVTKDEDGLWFVDFDVPGTYEEGAYSVTEEDVAGYTTKVFPMSETAGSIVVSNVLAPHQHTTTTATIDLLKPTCTTSGLRMKVEVCKECGEVVSSENETIPATGHDWGKWKTVKEATSTQEGLEQRTCANCSNVETRVIPKTGHVHNLVHVDAVLATCTVDGTVEHWKCAAGEGAPDGFEPCGLLFLDAAGTQWVHEEGIVEHATGHDWGDWVVTTPATESETGIETRTCTHEGCGATQTRIIPKKGHVHRLEKVPAKAATCTEDGNIEYWKCAEGEDPCKLCFRDAEGAEWIHEEGTVVHATGHEWGEPVYTWNDDYSQVTATRTCTRCGESITETVVASPRELIAATCTTVGVVAHLSDDFEGADFDKQAKIQIVVAHDHDWGEATYEWSADHSTVTATHTCTYDPTHVESETVKASPKVLVPATCTEPGLAQWTSNAFEGSGFAVQTTQAEIPAFGHAWSEAFYTWSDDNSQVTAKRFCWRNSTHVEEETVGVTVEAKEATCTEDGLLTYTSGAFENEAFTVQTKSEVMPALGHDWGEWVVVTPATETTEGLEQRTCKRCGEVETRAIPAVVAYRYVGADGASWTKGSADALTLTFKRSVDDDKTLGLFAGITVDGAAVPEKGASGAANYTAASGSLVLALQPAFLETLSVGDHELVASFADGSARVAFSVKAAPAPTKPAAKSAAAKTGDALGVAAIVIVAVFAALAVALLLITRRKRNA